MSIEKIFRCEACGDSHKDTKMYALVGKWGEWTISGVLDDGLYHYCERCLKGLANAWYGEKGLPPEAYVNHGSQGNEPIEGFDPLWKP